MEVRRQPAESNGKVKRITQHASAIWPMRSPINTMTSEPLAAMLRLLFARPMVNDQALSPGNTMAHPSRYRYTAHNMANEPALRNTRHGWTSMIMIDLSGRLSICLADEIRSDRDR